VISPYGYEKVKYFFSKLFAGDWQSIVSVLSCRLHMEEICYLMCRSGGPMPENDCSSNALTIQMLAGTELTGIFDRVEKISLQERLWFDRRRRLIKYGIGRCYVTFNPAGLPCHFQWVFDCNDNEKLKNLFKGEYPRIGPEEILLEHALTLRPYQGNRVHSAARSKVIALEERNNGIRQFKSFINVQNVPAMRTARNLGFVPVMIRRERWHLFCHSFVFEKYDGDEAAPLHPRSARQQSVR